MNAPPGNGAKSNSATLDGPEASNFPLPHHALLSALTKLQRDRKSGERKMKRFTAKEDVLDDMGKSEQKSTPCP